jgi:hypothetical protein
VLPACQPAILRQALRDQAQDLGNNVGGQASSAAQNVQQGSRDTIDNISNSEAGKAAQNIGQDIQQRGREASDGLADSAQAVKEKAQTLGRDLGAKSEEGYPNVKAASQDTAQSVKETARYEFRRSCTCTVKVITTHEY